MNSLISFVECLAKPKRFAPLCMAAVIPLAGILMTLGQLMSTSGGYGILDFEIGYSPERVQEVFASYGERGMALYGRIQLFDLVNPALYSLVGAAITAMVWQGRRWIVLAPFLAGLGDYLENITLYLISSSWPDVPPSLVFLSSSLSYLKYALMVVAFAPLMIGLVQKFNGWMKRV